MRQMKTHARIEVVHIFFHNICDYNIGGTVSLEKVLLYIQGMTCEHCSARIKNALDQFPGILNVDVSYAKRVARFSYDPDQITLPEITSVLEHLGYKASTTNRAWRTAAVDILIVVIAFATLRITGILNYVVPSALGDSNMSYFMLFAVGAMTSVHCIAMCGGLHLSQTFDISEKQKSHKMFMNTLQYQCGRLLSYSIIGGILGGFGSLTGFAQNLQHAYTFQGLVKALAGVLLILMGVNMLGWIPGIQFHIPAVKKIKMLHNRTPFVIGIFNGFMPCGPLQAMQLVAIASGSFTNGMFSMFFFCLGTIPLMLGFGSIVAVLGQKYARTIMHLGAIVIVVMGVSMIWQGGILLNINPLQTIHITQTSGDHATIKNGTQYVYSRLQYVYSRLQSGKYPDIYVQAGIPVEWHITADQNHINGCNNRIISSDFDIEYNFIPGDNVIKFQPSTPGLYTYTCWMGMITGKIHVEG